MFTPFEDIKKLGLWLLPNTKKLRPLKRDEAILRVTTLIGEIQFTRSLYAIL